MKFLTEDQSRKLLELRTQAFGLGFLTTLIVAGVQACGGASPAPAPAAIGAYSALTTPVPFPTTTPSPTSTSTPTLTLTSPQALQGTWRLTNNSTLTFSGGNVVYTRVCDDGDAATITNFATFSGINGQFYFSSTQYNLALNGCSAKLSMGTAFFSVTIIGTSTQLKITLPGTSETTYSRL